MITEFKKIHDRGWAYDNEEFQKNIRCMAVPIFNANGKVVAAMSISVPTVRVSKSQLLNYLPRLKEVSMDLSKRLGYKYEEE